jgi:FkbM family methyltransferase
MSQAHGKRIIYDFGANSGSNLPYYLRKSDQVVAVEANPSLAQDIGTRFANAISDGSLVLKTGVLSGRNEAGRVKFYIHKTHSTLSQFPRPERDRLGEFDEVLLPAINVVDLIAQHGDPYYIKIDTEHYDAEILRALFDGDIRPPYISSESHGIEVFSLLVASGGYRSFNLVDGATVSRVYGNHRIATASGEVVHSFPHDSAGPFGEDIAGPWMTPDNFFRFLAFEGLGWKDVHATTEIEADPQARPRLRSFFLGAVLYAIKSGLGLG